MKTIFAASAALALLCAGATLPTVAHAQTEKGCVEGQNTQKMPTQASGQAINGDRTAPCEKVEGMNTQHPVMGSPKEGTTGPAVNAPVSTEGGGAGMSQ